MPTTEEMWIVVQLETGTFEWCHERMTYQQIAEARRTLGTSPRRVLEEAFSAADLDTVLHVVWLARFCAGENVTLQEVTDGVDGHAWVKLSREARPVNPET